jgi:cysteine desulfurase / selenocysteine lyase
LLHTTDVRGGQTVSGFADDGTEVSKLDLRTIGAQFPIKGKRVYLNNASIAPISEPVLGAVNEFLHDVRDNGRNNYPIWCGYAENEIKGRIARLIGASAQEIAFVKNTTEGLIIVANGLNWRDGDNVIIADIEYPSNVYCWMRLAKLGVKIRWIKSQQGRIPIDLLAQAIDSRTRLISLSAVQFSNGFRQDLAAASELCQSRGVLLNLDAIQWIGALEMDLRKYRVDFLSAGGHKWLLGPIGTGIFYCNQNSMEYIDPPNVGYHSVDKDEAHMDYELIYRNDAGRFEEALVNFPGIWGLDAAIKILLGIGPAVVEKHILELNSRASEALNRHGYDIVSPQGADERSGILSFSHPRFAATAIEARLYNAGIDVAVRGGSVRISPSYFNDKEEIAHFVDTLPR